MLAASIFTLSDRGIYLNDGMYKNGDLTRIKDIISLHSLDK